MVRAGARFCTTCGATQAEATQAVATPPRPAAPAAPAPRPAGTPPAAGPPRRGVGPWPIAALALAILVAGGLVASALGGGDGDSVAAPGGGDGSAVATTDGTQVGDDGEPTETGPEVISDGPPSGTGTPVADGRYVRLGSFRSEEGASEEAARLEAEGIATEVVDSNETAGLLPAFFVIVSGPTAGAEDERRRMDAAERAGVGGPLVGELGVAPATDPTALASYYFGTVDQVDPDVDARNRELEVSLTFGPGGDLGTASYDEPACESELTHEDSAGAALIYRERVVSGPCADGGLWHVKLEGAELLATWWADGEKTFRVGRLEP